MPTARVPTKPAATKTKAKAPSPARAGEGESAAALIDAKIAALADWRGEMLARLRALILAADPGVIEEWKWSVPVLSHHGLICTGET